MGGGFTECGKYRRRSAALTIRPDSPPLASITWKCTRPLLPLPMYRTTPYVDGVDVELLLAHSFHRGGPCAAVKREAEEEWG
jgi:hypothetical protein